MFHGVDGNDFFDHKTMDYMLVIFMLIIVVLSKNILQGFVVNTKNVSSHNLILYF
jgi:hypothetical protein